MSDDPDPRDLAGRSRLSEGAERDDGRGGVPGVVQAAVLAAGDVTGQRLLDDLDDARRTRGHGRRRRAGALLAVAVVLAGTAAGVVALVLGSAGAWAVVVAALWGAAHGAVPLLLLRGARDAYRENTAVAGHERRHRNHLLAGWDGDRGETRLLDAVTDARRHRGVARRRVEVAATLCGAGGVALAAGLVIGPAASGPWWPWWPVAAGEVLVVGLLGLTTAVVLERRHPSGPALRRAEREHRDLTLYGACDGVCDENPDDPRAAALGDLPRRTRYAIPVLAVCAALTVLALPGPPDPAAVAPAPLAARSLPATLDIPGAVTLSPGGRRIYVANFGAPNTPADTVSVLDARTGDVVNVLTVGPEPLELALSPDGTRLYTTLGSPRGGPSSTTMTIVDTETSRMLATVPVGASPTGLAASPDGRTIYVSTTDPAPGSAGTLVAVDAATGAVRARIPVGASPGHIVVSRDGTQAYLLGGGNSVSVIDLAAGRLTRSIAVGPGATDLALSPTGATLYAAVNQGNDPADDITTIDTRTMEVSGVAASSPGTGRPYSLATIPDGRLLIGRSAPADASGASVAVFDPVTRTVTASVPTPCMAFDVVASPDGHHAWATTCALWSIDLP